MHLLYSSDRKRDKAIVAHQKVAVTALYMLHGTIFHSHHNILKMLL